MKSFWEQVEDGTWEDNLEMDNIEQEFLEENYSNKNNQLAMQIANEDYEDEETNFQPRQAEGEYINVNPNEKAKQAYYYYLKKGLPKHVAAGIVGNLMQESGLNHTITGDGGKAYGLAQWHPNRRQAMKDNSFYGQLDYILNEPNESSRMLEALSKTSTPEEAAEVFERVYERAGNPMLNRRKSYARKIYDGFQYGGSQIIYDRKGNPYSIKEDELVQDDSERFKALSNINNNPTPSSNDKPEEELYNFGFVEQAQGLIDMGKQYISSAASNISNVVDTTNSILSNKQNQYNYSKRIKQLQDERYFPVNQTINNIPIYT